MPPGVADLLYDPPTGPRVSARQRSQRSIRSPGATCHGLRHLAAGVILILLLTGSGSAQEPDTVQIDRRPEGFIDVRAGAVTIEEITTEGDLPVAGFEASPVNGAFIQSASGIFRVQFGAYAQVRWNGNWRDAPEAGEGEREQDDFTRGWSLNRTRIFLEGKYTDRTAYHFRASVSNSFDIELLAAWGQLRLSDRWSVIVGKHFAALSREDWTFAQDLLTIEYSPNDLTYAIGPSFGVFAAYAGDRQRFWLSFHNGAFGGRDEFPSFETDAAVTGRWEWNVTGDDWQVWNDMVGRPGRAQVTMLGLSGAYQSKQSKGSEENNAGAQVNLDLNVNGDGYQVVVAGSATWLDPINAEAFTNYGLMAQGGYFVGRATQLYAQYNLLHPGDQPGDLEVFNSVTLGASYFPYLWTNRWKLSAEAAYLFSALSNTVVEPSGSLGWLASDEPGQAYLKLQAQFGF